MRRIDETLDFLNQRDGAVRPLMMVLALIGLGRLARLASVGVAGLWLVNYVRDMDRVRSTERPDIIADRQIDAANEDSFPASDAPAYSSQATGAPDERPERLN